MDRTVAVTALYKLVSISQTDNHVTIPNQNVQPASDAELQAHVCNLQISCFK